MSKKYISPERLAQYDEKIKDVIDNAVTELQNGAVKDNADAIAELESKVGAGFRAITIDEIDAMFAETTV